MNNNHTHKSYGALPIKVPFPPPIEESELQPSMKKGKLPVRATNQFLLYRTAYIKTMRESGYQDINMRVISKLASDSWNLEPPFVQQEYKSLALKAKGLHQKTVKYLTSLSLEDTNSPRPLASMPPIPPMAEQDSTDQQEIFESQTTQQNVYYTPSPFYVMVDQEHSFYFTNEGLPVYEYYF
ncbi:1125_t:CDS:1 [Funneliformis caledonium]|uniref:1125_t:CDS:1 n=1 Tax=Funneliformis caledonium TaxID=1117310 RepID=A0A9N9BMZ9_9GLOM|nr:1125_t:CDS:1 [Funneliformis caledonium]